MPGLIKAGGDKRSRLRAAVVQLDSNAARSQMLAREGIEAQIDSEGPQFAAALGELSVTDLLQLLALGRRDAVLGIAHAGGQSRLWCVSGDIVDAESGPLQAVAAVYRVLAIEQGRVSARFGADARRPRRVHLSTMELLLEGARRADEGNAIRRALGTARQRLAPGVSLADARWSAEERAVLAAFEGGRRVPDVVADSPLGDLETLSVIDRLVSQRHLLPDPSSEDARAPTTPASDLERPGRSGAETPPGATGSRGRALRWWPMLGLLLGGGAWSLHRVDVSESQVFPHPSQPSPPSASVLTPALRPGAGGGAAAPSAAVVEIPAVVLSALPSEPSRPLEPSGQPGASPAVEPPSRRPPRLGHAAPSNRLPAVVKAPASATPPVSAEPAHAVARMQLIEDQVPRIRVLE